jgi:hypothetical protein
LKAGVSQAEMVIVTSKEKSQELNDEYLGDSTNIFACHKLHKIFPNLKIVVELTNASNIRFLKFNETVSFIIWFFILLIQLNCFLKRNSSTHTQTQYQ